MSYKKSLLIVFVAALFLLSACGSGKSDSSRESTTTTTPMKGQNKNMIDSFARSIKDGTANRNDVNDAVGRVCWVVEEIDRYGQWLLIESFGEEDMAGGTKNYEPNKVRVSPEFLDGMQKSLERSQQILDLQKVREDIRPFADTLLTRVKRTQTDSSQLTQSSTVVETQEFINKSFGDLKAYPAFGVFETAKKTSRACFEVS